MELVREVEQKCEMQEKERRKKSRKTGGEGLKKEKDQVRYG